LISQEGFYDFHSQRSFLAGQGGDIASAGEIAWSHIRHSLEKVAKPGAIVSFEHFG
jgi:hypothetical protein